MIEEKEIQRQTRRIEELVREIEAAADEATRAKALALVRALMDYHGAALERMTEIVTGAGAAVLAEFARDPLVASLLLLYGLHPVGLEGRVAQALERVRPYLASHGGDVELLGISDGVVRLRLRGSCHSCPSSAQTLKLAIEEAIYEAAPDVAALEVEGVTPPAPAPGLVQIGLPRPATS